MKPWYRSFLYLFTLPADLLMLLLAVIVRVTWGSAWGFRQGVLVVDLAATSKPATTWWRRWGGAALVHVVILNTAHSRVALEERVLPHELAHVQQHEAASVAGFAVGLAVLYFAPVLALLIWASAPGTAYLAAMAVAALRGLDPYRKNHLEAAAYDHTAVPRLDSGA